MNLGELMSRLEGEISAATALEALCDIALFTRVTQMGVHYEETPGEYVANAARRFARLADDEDWLALMSGMERSHDPAHAALSHMLQWALLRDEKEQCPDSENKNCACGGGGAHHASP